MAKQTVDAGVDELLADSLQMENYLKQTHTSRLSVLHLGMESFVQSYLERYNLMGPQVQFQVFLFSRFYARKMNWFVAKKRGEEDV